MNEECAFDLTLRRSALRSLSREGPESSYEISGSVGKVKQINMLEGELLEIHGDFGVLRLSIPRKLLDLLASRLRCEPTNDKAKEVR